MNKNAKPIAFGSFKSEEPEMNLVELEAQKWHKVKISRTVEITDRHNSLTEPTLKDKEYEWSDPTDQLAVIFVGKEGSIIHRFNACGFVRFDDVPDAEKKNYVSAGTEGYAVNLKTKKRVVSEKHTASCQNIMNNLFNACKKDGEPLPVGSETDQLSGSELEVYVDSHTYNENEQKRVTRFRRVSSKVAAEEF